MAGHADRFMTSGIAKAPASWSGEALMPGVVAIGSMLPDTLAFGMAFGALCAQKHFVVIRSRSDDGLGLWRAVAICRGAVVAGDADAVVDRDAGAVDLDRQHPLLADERDAAAVVRHAAAMAGLSVDAADHRRRLAGGDRYRGHGADAWFYLDGGSSPGPAIGIEGSYDPAVDPAVNAGVGRDRATSPCPTDLSFSLGKDPCQQA